MGPDGETLDRPKGASGGGKMSFLHADGRGAYIFVPWAPPSQWYTSAPVMDANEHFAFPSPQPSDSPEVRSAIEQAGILWSEDPKESLKWLRKAAEFASDAGDDLRSVQLARVSADLRNLANISPSLPPTTLPPPSGLAQPTNYQPPSAAAGTEPSSGDEGTPAAAASGDAPGEPGTEGATTGGTEFTSAGADAPSTEITPNAPGVAEQAAAMGFGPESFSPGLVSDSPFAKTNEGSGQPGLTHEQIAAFMPNFGQGKDPAQTVPATPAATAAAAALANGPSGYQPFGGFQSGGYTAPAPAPRSTPSAASSPQAAASSPRWPEAAPASAAENGKVAMNTPAATPASKRPVGLTNTPSTWTGGPRPEQPTLVGSPLNGLRAEEQFRAEASGGTDPAMASRFVQHRAIAVAVSMTPNSSGHFDLHPLAEGEQVEPGFRMALLVGLSSDDRLFPGRG